MRRLLFSLFICCIIVFVYPRPTFTQKRTRATKAPAVKFDSKPLNLDLDQLPPNYIGNSYSDLLLAVYNRREVAVKGEFESTIDFKSRMARVDSQPLTGSLYFNSVLAFTFIPDGGQFSLKYDADLTTLDVDFKWTRFYGGDYRNPTFTLTWSERSKQVGAYTGRNAFNMRTRVRVYRNDEFFLGATSDALKQSNLQEISTSFFMPPFEARIAKGNMRALVIGRLAEKPLYHDQERDKPEITDPYDRHNFRYVLMIVPEEVWFYDFPTGKIYTRLPFDATESELMTEDNSIAVPTSSPRLLSKPQPRYTEKARSNQVTGTVILMATFTADGKVTNIRVIEGLPDGLDECAIEAAKQIKFVPAQKNGIPISKEVRLEYNFNLY